jgi:hypothetical protein
MGWGVNSKGWLEQTLRENRVCLIYLHAFLLPWIEARELRTAEAQLCSNVGVKIRYQIHNLPEKT